MKKTFKPRRGFTLVELLVTFSIIAVLAAVLGLSFRNIRQSAREVQNMNNLRQLGVTCTLYAADHNFFFPTGAVTSGEDTGANWRGLVEQYLRPGAGSKDWAEATRKITNSPTATKQNAARNGCHYSINGALAVDPSDSPTWLGYGKGVCPVNIPNINRPSQVILMADAPQVYDNGDAHYTFYIPSDWGTWTDLARRVSYNASTDVDTPYGPGLGAFRFRNRGKLHAVHVDGSVKAYGKNDLIYGNIIPNR